MLRQDTCEAEQVTCKWMQPGRGNASAPQARGDCKRINTLQRGLLQNAVREPVLPTAALQQRQAGTPRGRCPWGPCAGPRGIELLQAAPLPPAPAQPQPRAAGPWEQPPQLLRLQDWKEVRSDRVDQISGHPKNNNNPPFSLAALPHAHLPCLNWKIKSLLRSAGRFSR